MSHSVSWTLPAPSTSFLEGGVTLDVRLRREAALCFAYEEEHDGTPRRCAIVFQDIQAFKCTYMRALDDQMLEAYDCILDRGTTAWLEEVLANVRRRDTNARKLFHFSITFDDGPAYEFICGSYRVETGRP